MVHMFCMQCSAKKFHNWGHCPSALEKVGTFQKKVGTFHEKVGTWLEKWWESDLKAEKSVSHHFTSLLTMF